MCPLAGSSCCFGRTLADVILPHGRSLNQELVRAGYAWWFHRYWTDRTLEALAAEARAARRGLWADWHPLPPWDGRERQHLGASPLLTRLGPPAPPEIKPGGSEEHALPIIANRRSQ